MRELIADRIERKDLRSRGRPKKVMSLRLACALIWLPSLRRDIRKFRRTGSAGPNFRNEWAEVHGTPKEAAFVVAGQAYGIGTDTLRHWFESPPKSRREFSSCDLGYERPSPPVDWDAVKRALGRRRKRLRPADRHLVAEAVRRDPGPPADILEVVRQLLDRTN